MRRRKGGEKILPCTSPNEQINASVPQEMEAGERERSYWYPKDQAKTLTQSHLPRAMNRSLFNLAQQYLGPGASHWAEL